MKSIVGLASALLLIAALAIGAQKQDQAERQLKAAMNTELVDGNLKAAIEQYKKLAQGSNRGIAAQALIHMGECYDKLGSFEARKQYELVISKFADQKDAVAQARAHLGESAAKTSVMAQHLVTAYGSILGPAISPDGRYVSFEDESSNLAVHDLTTLTDRRLTHDGGFPDGYPTAAAFAPDGKQIAYIWCIKQNCDLRILSLSGTGPVAPRIFKNANWEYNAVVWSPDGKWLAVYAGPGKPSQLVMVSVQDGSSSVLMATAANPDFVFSPDGKYLAYSRSNNIGSSDVFILAIDGGKEISVVEWPSNETVLGWSKDGHLLFSSDRTSSNGLWAVPFKAGKPLGPPVMITNIPDVFAVGQTPSGALYYHVMSGGRSTYLETAPFDFATGRILSSPVILDQGTAPAWSPDGKYIAYIAPVAHGHLPFVKISTEAGGIREMRSAACLIPNEVRWAPDSRTLASGGQTGTPCQFDAETAVASKIDTTNRQGDYPKGAPSWSPDQKKIYFRRDSIPAGGGDGSVAFIERDLASGIEKVIIQRPKSTDLGGLNLSPDGRYIATHADPPNSSAVVLIPVAGGEPKELIRRPGLGPLYFSPDGRYIALVGGSSRSAMIIPVGGGEPRELMSATAPLAVSMTMWAPDSRSIFLKKSTVANEQTEIWRVPVDGGQAVRLDMNMNLDHILGGFILSPSGRQIAFVRGETNPPKDEIWVLENYLSSIPATK